MEKGFLEKLGIEIQRLVQEIENFAVAEIRVSSTPTPSSKSGQPPKTLALISSEMGATILYRDTEDFRPQAVLHELLHLRRYWIDFVPQILPIDDPDGDKIRLANQIENTLEHLIIAPQEAAYGFDSYSPYVETTKKAWEDYPWPVINEPWARRKNCLLTWLTTSVLVDEPSIRDLAEQCLEKEGLLTEAQNFSEKIGRVLSSKEHCISTTIRFLQIPSHEATMVYLDIKNRKTLQKPIPVH
jgi:hypothetical protein